MFGVWDGDYYWFEWWCCGMVFEGLGEGWSDGLDCVYCYNG